MRMERVFHDWFEKERAYTDYPFFLFEKNASWYLEYHEVTHNTYFATRNTQWPVCKTALK